jgi:hypothetical protein
MTHLKKLRDNVAATQNDVARLLNISCKEIAENEYIAFHPYARNKKIDRLEKLLATLTINEPDESEAIKEACLKYTADCRYNAMVQKRRLERLHEDDAGLCRVVSFYRYMLAYPQILKLESGKNQLSVWEYRAMDRLPSCGQQAQLLLQRKIAMMEKEAMEAEVQVGR